MPTSVVSAVAKHRADADCVVDTSAIAALAWGEPAAAEVSSALAGSRLFASPMVTWEMANILLVKLRRHPTQAVQLRAGYDWFRQLKLIIVPIEDADIIACGERFQLSAYDAGYLALALTRDIPLVTLDQKLARAWIMATRH